MYEIGQKVWHSGDEVTITSLPYEMYGGMWQDGVTEDGKTLTIVTPDQKAKNVKQQQKDWQSKQTQFRKLRNSGN